MKEEQVNEKFLVLDLQAKLAADKREQAAHRTEKIFNAPMSDRSNSRSLCSLPISRKSKVYSSFTASLAWAQS